jgi:hypothetical protein
MVHQSGNPRHTLCLRKLAFDTTMVAHVVPRRSEPDDIGVSLDGAAPPDCRPRWRGRHLSSMPALMTALNIPLRLRDPDVSLPLVQRGLEYRWHVYKFLRRPGFLDRLLDCAEVSGGVWIGLDFGPAVPSRVSGFAIC